MSTITKIELAVELAERMMKDRGRKRVRSLSRPMPAVYASGVVDFQTAPNVSRCHDLHVLTKPAGCTTL